MADRKRLAGFYAIGFIIFVGAAGWTAMHIHTEQAGQGPGQVGASVPGLMLGSSPEPVSEQGGRQDEQDVPVVETRHFYSGPPHAPSSRDKVAYLTFDDGPSKSTREILRILKGYGVPATFFVVGTQSPEGKSLYREIAAEGHALGNHTYSHDYHRIYQSAEAFMKDVRKLDQLLEETIGYRPDILRFPGGSNNHLGRKSGGKGIMSRLAGRVQEEGYQYFDWNVSSTDAAAPVQDKEMIIESVSNASRGKNQVIVLMHDNTYKRTTVEALPVVIRKLKMAGFRFDKLDKSSFTFQFLKP
ncbi:polysaccharide deacetylase family protein [Paenibacillus sp. GCM10023248]|uniref:polysaccharide deacetylase family protein n=1 Tax=Bacillales TaxID=1385 RepID=UPI002379173A|nr:MULTISPECIES: polysaccharide deacetylase family protein [Bacillales]MDD9271077.1 polysaccharide deacetylase [Paenibacillus sp. MAHUQ-63]MDR6885048.1 peptidoglycan/xylan/chitin deacetylase (PgdA/CDA1 family) [Bacillus sp. 3255]